MTKFLPGALALLWAAITASGAFAQVAGGNFVSLDGVLEHHFAQSGDYLGKASDMDTPAVGVFREGDGVCWTTLSDGTKQPGNVLIYVGEVQCCMSAEAISDKVAFTQVWVKGTGVGYRMCTNQVFRRVAD